LHEHRRIFEAIVARDAARAEAEMRAHVRAGAAIRQKMLLSSGGNEE
jgi:DNA-binding FadR family transcriptional regulator